MYNCTYMYTCTVHNSRATFIKPNVSFTLNLYVRYICEKRNSTDLSAPTVTPTPEYQPRGYCPGGWWIYRGYCIKAFGMDDPNER